MSENTEKPFSIEYVVMTTARHMLKSIDTSIKKTLERIQEFDGNREKSEEIFKTLSVLHMMKRDVEQYSNALTSNTSDSTGAKNG